MKIRKKIKFDKDLIIGDIAMSTRYGGYATSISEPFLIIGELRTWIHGHKKAMIGVSFLTGKRGTFIADDYKRTVYRLKP